MICMHRDEKEKRSLTGIEHQLLFIHLFKPVLGTE